MKVIGQNSSGARCLKLVTAEGHVLNDPEEYPGAKVREGDHITATAQQALKLAVTSRAFALWRCESDGILIWGHAEYGGNSSNVQHQLQNVQQVKATERGFVAYLEDGSVGMWGLGRGLSQRQGLQKVQELKSTRRAFAAVGGRFENLRLTLGL